MNELRELQDKLNETLKNRDNVSSIGFDELDGIVNDLNNYKDDAVRIAQEARNNPDVDIYELGDILSLTNNISDKVYNETPRFDIEARNKHAMYLDKGRNRILLNRTVRNYENSIKTYDSEIAFCDARLNDSNITEAEKDVYRIRKETAENLKNQTQETINLLNIDIERLTDEMDKLKNGGELNLEENLDLDKEEENTKENTNEEVKDDELNAEENNTENKEESNEWAAVPPVPPLDIDLPPVPPVDEEDENLGEKMEDDLGEDDVMLPPIPPVDEDEENLDEGLGEDLGEDDAMLPPMPPIDEDELGDEKEEEDDLVTPVPVPVANVSEAKPSLLKKIGQIIYKAILALGAVAAIGGLGHHFAAHCHNDADIVEENPNDTKDEDEDKDLDDDKDKEQDKPSNPGTSNPTPSDPTPSNPTPSDPTPSDPTPGTPDEPGGGGHVPDTSDPIENDNTKFPIELGVGESAYNSETGVEVTHDGSAYLHEDDNKVSEQHDRDLEQTDHNTSIVTQDDMYPDLNPPVEPSAVPETGDEQSYEQAAEELTDAELDNLNDAFLAFEQELNGEKPLVP